MFEYDVVIIGGGPAGLTAGLYLSRDNRRTILVEKEMFGGPMNDWEWIENYPGFPDGVSGAHLASEMVTQATKYGLQLVQSEVTGIELYRSTRWVRCANGMGYATKAVIVANGSEQIRLGIPGEEEFTGRGVSFCATCDAAFFKELPVAVVGGGDSAITEALHLTRFARKVTVIHRRDQLRATPILQEKAFSEPKIEFLWNDIVEEIEGEDSVKRVRLRQVITGEESSLDVAGIFISIGFKPNTDYLKGILPLNATGHVVTNDEMETVVPGIFAAGDVRLDSARQATIAVENGTTAAISAQRFLRELV